MTRQQRKCVLASAALHSLLFAILFLGPAFLSPSRKTAENLPLLTVIPARLIDQAASGGGSAPPATVPVTQTPEPPQIEPRREPQLPVRDPEPPPKPLVEKNEK